MSAIAGHFCVMTYGLTDSPLPTMFFSVTRAVTGQRRHCQHSSLFSSATHFFNPLLRQSARQRVHRQDEQNSRISRQHHQVERYPFYGSSI